MDITKHFEPLQNWIDRLNNRERYTVIAGAVFLIISLFYLVIWEPVFSTLENEHKKYETQRELYFWMQDAIAEYKTIQSSGSRTSSSFKNQSISTLAERSAQSSGVKQQIKKLDSDSKGVKIELAEVSFDRLVLWLADMAKKYDIQVSSLHIEKLEEPGTVNARITLERDQA